MKRILLVFAILCFVAENSLFAQNKEITLEGIWKNYQFMPSGVPGFQPMPNGDFYTVTNKNGMDKHSFASGEKIETLVKNSDLQTASKDVLSMEKVKSYDFDKSEKQVLIAVELEPVYRRSSKAYYYILTPQKNN